MRLLRYHENAMRWALAATLVLALHASPGASAPGKTHLPFIEDDYAKALETARAKDVPIFIEAWAPW